MHSPLSPRAREILDDIERDVVARGGEQEARSAASDAPNPLESHGVVAPVPDASESHMLELIDELTLQADRTRSRLETLRSALQEELELPAPRADDPVPTERSVQGECPGVDEAPSPAPPTLAVTDLHHHILPGIDDGPADLDASLDLARAAVASGTRTVVATPHVSWDYPGTTATVIENAVADLREALAAENIPLEVLRGAEVAVTRAVDLPDEELRALRLGGGPYLLVECPFTPTATGFDFLLGSLLSRGHRILLAHPERCPAFQREPALLSDLVGRGVLVQVTAGALTGSFGRTARDAGRAYVRDGLAHVIASDAHSFDRRPPSVLAELELTGFSPALAAWLVDAMPRAILDGGPLPQRPVMPATQRTGLKRLLGR